MSANPLGTPLHPTSGGPVLPSNPLRPAPAFDHFCMEGLHTPGHCLDGVFSALTGAHPQVWLFDGMTMEGINTWPERSRKIKNVDRRNIRSGFLLEEVGKRLPQNITDQIAKPLQVPDELRWKPTPANTRAMSQFIESRSQHDPDGEHIRSASYCSSCLRLPETTEYNPYLICHGWVVDRDTGRLRTANEDSQLPRGLATRYTRWFSPGFSEGKLEKDTVAYWRSRSSYRDVLESVFDMEALTLYVNIRKAFDRTLGEFESEYKNHFAAAYPDGAGVMGVGIVKIRPNLFALVAFGDSIIGYARNGEIVWSSTPEINRFGSYYFAGIAPPEKGAPEKRYLPAKIEIKFLTSAELAGSIIFGTSDGLIDKDFPTLILDKLAGHLSNPEALMSRGRQLAEAAAVGTSFDDRSFFVLQGKHLA